MAPEFAVGYATGLLQLRHCMLRVRCPSIRGLVVALGVVGVLSGFVSQRAVGAAAATAEQNPMCQEISVQVLPDQDPPDVSGIALSPTTPDLGCSSYPSLLLLMGNIDGTVQFNMQVLASGTVERADIVSVQANYERHSSLLGLFAQALAWKLQFVPATQAGQPIDVVRRVDIAYKVKFPLVRPPSRPIH